MNVWAGGSVKSQTGTKNADGTYTYTNDGKLSCTGLATCSADYPYGAVVRLLPTTTTGNYFNGFAGDCQGYVCDLTGNAEKSVIAMFTKTPESHPNWIGDSTVHPTKMGELNCMQCHGSGLQGIGIAPNCYSCHKADGTGGPLQQTGATAQEICTTCHPQSIGTTQHQAVYNKFTDGTATGGTLFSGSISSVTATALTDGSGLFKITVKFSLAKSGTALTTTQYSALGQKRLSMTKYDAATKKFYAVKYVEPSDGSTKSVSFGTPTIGTDGLFTTTAAKAPFDPNAVGAPISMFYFYFADTPVIPPSGHYFLPDNTISISTVTGGAIDWSSTANAAACTKCHGTPYGKHGYRQAVVAGLPDLASCKACHYDDRGGVDFNLAMTYEDPARLAYLETQPLVGGEIPWSPEDEATYAYTATTMQDTHISHAKEFLYPQSMANCATCHEGKLSQILTDANFTAATCKSCHLFVGVNGADSKRAPKLTPAYHNIDWVKGVLLETDQVTGLVTEMQCNECHNATWVAPWDPTGLTKAPVFSQLHSGYNSAIYNSAGVKYASAISTSAVASYDPATKKITATFTVTGADAGAIVKPTVVVSLYGYDTKDFMISGHSSQFADKTPNLEWSEGAVIRGTTTPANTSRLTVLPATASAGVTTWTATADLTAWAANLTDGSIKKAEIGFLPSIGVNQAAAPQCDATKTNYNKCIAIGGATATVDLTTGLQDNAMYGKDIVDPAKCNKCHDALAVEFHSPNYGSAGVVGCRLCHFVGAGGSHLEMQSRSIDSYVHAIHSFQAFDVNGVNFTDTVQNFEYEHHISATYPNFTILNCESCHNAGKYDLPDPKKSLPGILSASSTVNKARSISGVSTVVVGPASRACGSCHRSEAIKADDAAALSQLDQHAATFGVREGTSATTPSITDVFLNVIKRLFP
ncbi:multiheme c-type cytochrome [Anaeromyxobacter oryzisoli]|uniref:multiheme c-type cytochrome n=1 Tax=Anaeromyxobacter oryzisoli TaxID=2925408 RepID=UPI001F57CDC3|nr:hypothetical protein [Anaeromyxobacter sp. SG63]